ncbi:histidinol-phosphate aminotransferase family protein [Porticoccaceae bacterium]|nr:histidinol-phosphate aminotransferase family protein [Porticoccaceae bacterium]
MSANQHLDIFETLFHNPSMFEIRSGTSFKGDLTDFCVPANSYFPPPKMVELIKENMADILKYYPDYAPVHQQCIADLCGAAAENIVAANGITEVITILCKDSKGSILTSVPTFGRWTDIPPDFDIPVHFAQREKANDFKLTVADILNRVNETGAQTVVISNPNNPTGAYFSNGDIKTLLKELSHIQSIIIDESFIEFSDLESAEALAVNSHNMIVVKSMGKSLGWHGIRLGYAVANTQLAQELRNKLPYWNINGLAGFVLKNMSRFRDEYKESFLKVAADRDYMYHQLQKVQALKTYPSQCNFLFSELPPGVSGIEVRDLLLEQYGLVVRECSNKEGSTASFLRNVVRRPADTDKLVHALKAVLDAYAETETPEKALA